MNTNLALQYDFKARRNRMGLLITGHVIGQRPGTPYLEPEPSLDPEVRVYRLCFRADQIPTGGFDHLERKPEPQWRTLRILLPGDQEFVIHSQPRRG